MAQQVVNLAIAGPSDWGTSLDDNTERTMNYYVAVSEKPKRGPILIAFPGLKTIATAGIGPVRGSIEFGGEAYFVSGNQLYKLDALNTVTAITGTMSTWQGQVGIAQNGSEIMIVDGTTTGYIYDGATLTAIADPDFLGGTNVKYVDGFFMFNRPGTGIVQISDLLAGTVYDPLDVKTAEALPDDALSLDVTETVQYIFGERTTEVWFNQDNEGFPFGRYPGGVLQWGIAAPYSSSVLDNNVIWLGRHQGGAISVVGSRSATSLEILSTESLDRLIASYQNISNAYAASYYWDGHFFYQLHFPDAGATWVYDLKTKLWTEASTPTTGYRRMCCPVSVGGKVLCGDPLNGTIYELTDTVNKDGTEVVQRYRITPISQFESRPVRWWSVNVEHQAGVGNSSELNPKVILEYSGDRGRTWSYERIAELGVEGDYTGITTFNRLGTDVDRVYRISFIGDYKSRVIGATARLSYGTDRAVGVV
jgi:hypothetical protein